MTHEQAVLKLKGVKANMLIAIDKLAHSKRLRANEKIATGNEYKLRIEAIDIAIEVLSKCHIIT